MNREQTLFYCGFVLILVIGILHSSALVYEWYFTYSWFDIVLHFLGGMWVAVFTFWLALYSHWQQRALVRKVGVTAFVLLVVAGLGLLWEVYEYVVGTIQVGLRDYLLDTGLDLTMDMLGAIGALLLFRHKSGEKLL